MERARRYFELMDEQSGIDLVNGTLGTLHYYMGNHDKALHFLSKNVDTSLSSHQIKEVCRIFGTLGGIYYNQCDYEQAIQAHSNQFKFAEKCNDKESIGKALGGLALVYLDLDQPNKAFDYIVEKMEISRSIGDRMGFTISIGLFGKYYGFRGVYLLAEQCIAYCLEEAIEIKDWRYTANLLGWQGYNLLEQGRDKEAFIWIDHSLRLCRQLQIPFFECNALYLMSKLTYRKKRYNEALEYAREALGIARRIKRKDMQLNIQLQLLDIKIGLGHITPLEATKRLQQMLGQYPDEREQASIRYAIWKLEPGSFENRTAALLLNESLYRKSGKHDYLRRCRDMQGSCEIAAQRTLPQHAMELIRNRESLQIFYRKLTLFWRPEVLKRF